MAATTRRRSTVVLALAVALLPLAGGRASGQDLRVVTYNTANDVGPNNTDFLPRTGMADVLKAIGALNVDGIARPIDVLALQESVYSTGPGINPTAQGFVDVLNSIYGPGAYAAATLNGQTDGNFIGNGPQTLVYRTSTVQLVSQQALGTPSGSGVARQVMEYGLHPVGAPAGDVFYLFNDHFKAGSTTSDLNRRGVEGNIVAGAAKNTLPANSSIIFAGDYNPTNNTNDPGYATVTTRSGLRNNFAIDPLNPNQVFQNWSSPNFLGFETASPATSRSFDNQSITGMRYRDDFLLDSPAATNGGGVLTLVPGSYVELGNTGTHEFGRAITTGSAAAFAAELPGYSTADALKVLSDLASVSDHLPVVADYKLRAVPEPSSLWLLGLGGAAAARLRRRRRAS